MKHPDFDQQLHTLKSTLEQSEGLEAGSRERLLKVIDQLEQELHTAELGDGGVKSQLEAHVAEFEVSHPSLARTINEFMVILGNMGV